MDIVNIFGVATARSIHSCRIHEDNAHIDVPMGPCVARWNIETQKRVLFKQLHQDAITNLIYRCGYVLITTYGGEFSLWDPDYSVCHWRMHVRPTGPIMHAAWSLTGDLIALASYLRHPGHDGYIDDGSSSLTLWKLDAFEQLPTLLWRREKCLDASVVMSASGRLLATIHTFVLTETSSKLADVSVIAFDVEGKEVATRNLGSAAVQELVESVDGRTFTLNQGRVITVLNENLDVLWRAKAPDTGSIFATLILPNPDNRDAPFVLTPSSTGLLLCAAPPMKMNASFGGLPLADVLSSVDLVDCPSYLELVSHGEQRFLWAVDQRSIYRIPLESEKFALRPADVAAVQKLSSRYDLTGCGVDLDLDGLEVAGGDLVGNVCVWSIEGAFSEVPAHSARCQGMIRALTWKFDESGKYLYLGTMDGNVWRWAAHESSLAEIGRMSETVTCVLWCHGRSPRYVALSDTRGRVAVCREEEGDDPAESPRLEKLIEIEAHAPANHVNSNEVWSLAWSPDGKYLATGGEDHTVHVYRFTPPSTQAPAQLECMHVLTGQTMAVTCLDWRSTALGVLLAVSSDDRTLRVWRIDDAQAELVRELNCQYEHLMLTYCALEPRGYRLGAVTMSGQLAVWDLRGNDSHPMLSCKLHVGSIEGLRWHRHHHLLATISSDCTLTVLRLRGEAV